jgi:hypothetical protein
MNFLKGWVRNNQRKPGNTPIQVPKGKITILGASWSFSPLDLLNLLWRGGDESQGKAFPGTAALRISVEETAGEWYNLLS